MTSVTSPRPLAWIGRISLFAIGLIVGLALPIAAFAADFTVSGSDSSSKTLGSGSGQTGTVTSTGSLSVTSSVAVTISGNNATLNNSGTIKQTTDGRAIQANATGVQIQNNAGATIQTQESDAIRAGNSNANTSISLVNAGTIQVLAADGGQAIDWAGITGGANSITNSGLIKSTGEDAVRPGKNGVINNSGTILAVPVSGSGSDGIQADNTGVQITNTGSISGRHAITGGGSSYTITVTNNLGGTIAGSSGSGVNIDGTNSSSGATVVNRGTITGGSTTGDGDGVDVDGTLTLDNYGIIRGLDAAGSGNNSEGIAAGGGTIKNYAGAEISGKVVTGTATNLGRGITIDDSNNGGAFSAVSIENSGTIRGYSGGGIKIAGTFGDTVTNNAGGVIRSAGSEATVQTGDGGDTVTNNAGATIQHDTGGKAVFLEGGNDTLNYNGGTIAGAIDGGTGTNTLNLGNGVSHAYATQNFQNVNVTTGSATLAGQVSGTTLAKGGAGALSLAAANTYTGGTTVAAGTLLVNNGSGSGTGTGNVLVQSGATIGGSGIISGLLTVDGILAPGNSLGTLTVLNSVVWDGSAANKWAFELGNGGLSDRLNVGGDFLKGTGNSFYFDFLSGGGPGTFVLVDWAGASTFLASDFNYVNLGAGYTGAFAINGSQLEFTASAIPEPSTYAALLGLGALGFAAWRRRSHRTAV